MPVAWAAEEAFANATGAKIVTDWTPGPSQNGRFHALVRRLQRVVGVSTSQHGVTTRASRDVILFLMGLSKDVLPVLQDVSWRKWLYLFDTWEPGWQLTEDILQKAMSVQCVYMSSSQSVEHFRGRLQCDVQWLPQAAISTEFSPKALDWGKKRKTILNIGRTNRVLDDFFVGFSQKHGFKYLRDEYPGQMLFKTRAAFLSALYEAQIVVVHPRNFEYPELTGRVSMLTARNFEAYQSGGVVCGFKPDSGEFERVLDGFPFVEFGCAEQFEVELLSAVRDSSCWRTATEECMRRHTWECRVSKMAHSIQQKIANLGGI